MLDLSTAGTASELITRETDVCVIGAGVAGQTVARRLAQNGRAVLLAESGGRDFDKSVQRLAAGKNVGFEYYDLEQSRLRLFGGTTAIWGGRCVALDPIDFEKRDWVAHSGWPLTHADLDPFVDQAFAALDLRRPRDLASVGVPSSPIDPETLDIPLWSFDEMGERFTGLQKMNGSGIEVVLNATLVALETAGGDAVTEAHFAHQSGVRMSVKATTFVLAAGGIETPRLMLACAPDRPSGIGNDNDLVGRFFMEHPHARGGEIVPKAKTLDAYKELLSIAPRAIRHNGRRFAPAFRPSDTAQAQLGLLNSAFSFGVRRHEGQSVETHARLIEGLKHGLPAKRRFRQVYHRGKKLVNTILDRTNVDKSAKRLVKQSDSLGLYAVMRAEQAPNPDSRVALLKETDAFGIRRVSLDWRFQPIDRYSVGGIMGLLDSDLRRLDLGHVEKASWLREDGIDWKVDPLVSSHPIGGYHHMGTTRMASTPREGVCDANCRVFDTANLYVAGSSLFPTGGWANPTITIMALAMRLGDHLATRSKG